MADNRGGVPPGGNIAAQIMITVFDGGRPPAFESTVDQLTSIRILGGMIMSISSNMQQAVKRPLPPMADKKREYLGPRKGDEDNG